MISIRAMRQFHGAPISLRAVSELEKWDFPVSVRTLATLVDREFTGRITAGDVQCAYRMSVFSSGNWAVSAEFFDDGNHVGDVWELEFVLDRIHRIGTKLDGSLNPGERTTVGRRGSDPWIRENWSRITTLSATLHASWRPGDVIATVLIGLTGIGTVLFFASPGRVEARRCPDQPFDDHTPCVEFHKVSGTDPTDGTVGGGG
ncbi:hypothetical protein KBX50_27900 [Micromonospora sp. C51]|uniref:hypothetical protein n=1 Tax=Micromonospora sp. C51 TaxID=2824879 RepID=UPI001B368331|nr:hypothetical protein [Micromonospora sp. C51]MBQ1052265.1 hypothetical protein [Micromonospora sp. C51]